MLYRSNITTDRGNALFLILIAVALFAALSYAITQSGRGGGSISKEQSKLYAAQIMQTVTEMQQGAQRMILNGTPGPDIIAGTVAGTIPGLGTENSGFEGYETGADFCTTGATCLFAPEGGGITTPQMPRDAFVPDPLDSWNNIFTGSPHGFNGIYIDGLTGDSGSPWPWNSFPGVGTDAHDDNIQIFPLKVEVCKEINRGLGINDGEILGSFGDIPSGMGMGCIAWGDYGQLVAVIVAR